jgi:DNA-binding MarR family transcriptional regulator
MIEHDLTSEEFFFLQLLTHVEGYALILEYITRAPDGKNRRKHGIEYTKSSIPPDESYHYFQRGFSAKAINNLEERNFIVKTGRADDFALTCYEPTAKAKRLFPNSFELVNEFLRAYPEKQIIFIQGRRTEYNPRSVHDLFNFRMKYEDYVDGDIELHKKILAQVEKDKAKVNFIFPKADNYFSAESWSYETDETPNTPPASFNEIL